MRSWIRRLPGASSSSPLVELGCQSASLSHRALIGAPFSRTDIEPFPCLDDPFDLAASRRQHCRRLFDAGLKLDDSDATVPASTTRRHFGRRRYDNIFSHLVTSLVGGDASASMKTPGDALMDTPGCPGASTSGPSNRQGHCRRICSARSGSP